MIHAAPILTGVIACASLVAALYFLRFWTHTRDRFFLFFALSFAIEGVNRIVLYLAGLTEDAAPYYVVRLLAYGLIVAAIVDKNRHGR